MHFTSLLIILMLRAFISVFDKLPLTLEYTKSLDYEFQRQTPAQGHTCSSFSTFHCPRIYSIDDRLLLPVLAGYHTTFCPALCFCSLTVPG